MKVDLRQRVVAVAGREVLTADGVPLRLTLAASFHLADPATAHNRVSDYHDALYPLATTSGNTYVLGVPAAVVPLPERTA